LGGGWGGGGAGGGGGGGFWGGGGGGGGGGGRWVVPLKIRGKKVNRECLKMRKIRKIGRGGKETGNRGLPLTHGQGEYFLVNRVGVKTNVY